MTAKRADDAQRLETIRILQRAPERAARDSAARKAVIDDRLGNELGRRRVEPERRQYLASDVGRPLARDAAVGVILRNVDDVVQQRGRDRRPRLDVTDKRTVHSATRNR